MATADWHSRIGLRFGRLKILEIGPPAIVRKVICRCDCGTETDVYWSSLSTGRTLSCGCLRREVTGRLKLKHGLKQDPLYKTWKSMMSRCYNPRVPSFINYGGRGIKVCKRWHDFRKFYDDVQPRPAKHSLDRIDNNGPYSPKNVQWATQLVQSNNTRVNRLIEHEGVTRTLSEWARHLNLPVNRITNRLNRGYLFVDAIRPDRLPKGPGASARLHRSN